MVSFRLSSYVAHTKELEGTGSEGFAYRVATGKDYTVTSAVYAVEFGSQS